ncbi:MAG: hypothetical protein ACHQDY_00810 [Solirubrobacterales bacterium]
MQGGERRDESSSDDERTDVPAATRRATTIGRASLLTIVVGSVLMVVVAADRPTFPPTHAHFFPNWLAGPLGGLWPGFPHGGEAFKWVFTLALVTMYVSYLLSLRYAPNLRARWVVGAVVAVHAIVFLSPPLALTDIFNYVNYARMEVVHHLNPYTTIPIYEPHNDPAFDLSNWHHLLSPYGPLFTLITFAVVPLGVAASFWAFKAILMAASLGTILLVWKCARLLDLDPVKAIVFVGLNPVVLVWGLGGDHNDFIMMFLVVLGFYLLLRAHALRGRAAESSAKFDVGAGAAFVAALAVKASAGILLPVVLAGLISTPRRLLQVLGGMVAAGAVLAGVSVMAFGLHLPDLSTQGRLVSSQSPSNLLGLALGKGGATESLLHALSLVLAVWVLCACALAWRKRDSLTAAGWASVGLFLTLSWVLPWYVLWVLPLAALSRSRALRATALGFGVFFMLVWAPLAGNVFRQIGFEPEKTSLGQLHQRYVKELLN